MKTPLPKTPPQSQEQQAPKDNSEEFPPLPVPAPRPCQVLVANRDSPAKGESQKCAQSEKRVAVTGSAWSVNEVARLRSENEHLRQQVKKLTDQLSVLSDKISSLTAQLAGNKSVQQCDANEAKACDVFITFLRSNPAVLQALEKTFPASSK
jgi:predicted RNase H-like nuclease (RuvC/YqgF family)